MFHAKRSRKKKKSKSLTLNSRFSNCLKWLFRSPEQKPEPVKDKAREKPICDLGEQYYTTKEVANALQVSVSALCEYRRRGTGPKYIVLSYRNYRYPKSEIIKHIENMTRASTSANRNYGHNPNEQKGD